MEAAFSLRVPLCGLPCVEMRIEPAAPLGARATGGCPAGREAAAGPVDDGSTPSVGGRAASEQQAVAAAAALLLQARSPFVFGLSLSSCRTARKAASIARRLGGALDVEAGARIENDLRALRTLGLPSATFGEVTRSSEVVLLWRCDPRADHPHLLSPRLPVEGGAERLFIVAPPAGRTRTGEVSSDAELVLNVAGGGDLDALLALRALVSGRPLGSGVSGGVPHADLQRAAVLLRRACHAAILWDPSATSGPDGTAIAAALTLLTRDLNLHGRAAARPLGAGGNVAGAMAAILSECGLARAIGFAGGVAREAPEVFGAGPMLAGGADALLLVGARTLLTRPGGGAVAVVIGPRLPQGCADPEVFIPTSFPAFSERGLWVRADGVPVPMRAPSAATRPSESEVLRRLCDRLASDLPGPARSGR